MLKIKKEKQAVELKECPIGLFMYQNTLALKTEYCTNEGIPECYIISSGETFCGGVDKCELPFLMVYPCRVISEKIIA
jgi:hypothetical protein